MSTVQQGQTRQTAKKLPPLTDAQVERIAALLSVATRRQVTEGRGGR